MAAVSSRLSEHGSSILVRPSAYELALSLIEEVKDIYAKLRRILPMWQQRKIEAIVDEEVLNILVEDPDTYWGMTHQKLQRTIASLLILKRELDI